MFIVICNCCLCFCVVTWLQLDLVSCNSQLIGWEDYFCPCQVTGWVDTVVCQMTCTM